MRKKTILIIVSLFLLELLSYGIVCDVEIESKEIEQIKLDEILKRAASYCENLASSALFYTCQEKVEETLYHYDVFPRTREDVDRLMSKGYTYGDYLRRIKEYDPNKIEKNIYIYDYQLIKKGNDFDESRTLLEENGEKRNIKNAKLKTKKFYSKKSVFGPVGLLSKDWQVKHEYKILREETVDGREAVVIEVLPKEKKEKNPNYGRIWIDKKHFYILRIEVEQESLKGFDQIKAKGITPDIKVTHLYGIEKRGIRFPSQTTIEESCVIKNVRLGMRQNLKLSKIVFAYSDYKFFTVEVDIKY